MFGKLFKRNNFTFEEYNKIMADFDKRFEMINLFKNSPHFSTDLQLIEKINNYEIPNAYDYMSDKNEFTALNVYHMSMVYQYIFMGYRQTPFTQNTSKLCSTSIVSIGKIECDATKNVSKEFYYGAIISSLFDYYQILEYTKNKSDISEYSNYIVNHLAWFFFSINKLIWFQEFIKGLGKFMTNKNSLETCIGEKVELPDEIFLGIQQRYQCVLQKKIENVSVAFQGFN